MRASQAHLLQCFCEIIQGINHAVEVDRLVLINSFITAAGAEGTVDELCLSRPRGFLERIQEVLDGRLKGS